MNKVLLTLASALVVFASGSGPAQAGTPLPSTIAWPTSPIMQAAQSVGSLAGGGSVDASGQYHYSLPIDVPPGLAGMQPSLSVMYSSRAGNGLLGWGFSLAGTASTISPCNRTLATDGNATGMAFDGMDVLCWDGQHLIQASSTANTVTYRTEHDSFANVVFSSNGSTFQIQTKSGHVLTFSDCPGAANAGGSCSGGQIQTIDHVLTQDADHAGNSVLYAYNVISPGEYYPLQINYGVSTQGGGRSRTIQFNYAPKNAAGQYRPDPIVAYRNGVSFTTNRLLQSIVCLAPAPSPALTPATTATLQPSTVVWSYTFTYTTANTVPASVTKRSLLNTVTKTGALGGTLLARQFEWQSSLGPVYAGDSNNDIGPAIPPAVPAPPTLGPQNPITQQGFAPFQVADFRNAGTDEVVTPDGVVHSTLPGPLPTPPGWPLLSAAATSVSLGAYVNQLGLQLQDAQVGDVDGDGVPELMMRVPTQSAWMRFKWNPTLNPPDFGPGVPLGLADADLMTCQQHCLGGQTSVYVANPVYLVDLDGDGLPDIVYGQHVDPCFAKGTDSSSGWSDCAWGFSPPGFSATLDYNWSVRWNGPAKANNPGTTPGTFGAPVPILTSGITDPNSGAWPAYGPLTANSQDAFITNGLGGLNQASGRGTLYFGSYWNTNTGPDSIPDVSGVYSSGGATPQLYDRYVAVEFDATAFKDGITNTLNTSMTNFNPAAPNTPLSGDDQVIMADMNGDGLEDTIVYGPKEGSFCISAWGGSNSSAGGTGLCITLPQTYVPGPQTNATIPYRAMVFDAQSTGREDVFILHLNANNVPDGPGMRVYLDATGTLQYQNYPCTTAAPSCAPYLTGDFNGDGLADVIALAGPGGAPQVKTLITPTQNLVFGVVDLLGAGATPLEAVGYSRQWWPTQTNAPSVGSFMNLWAPTTSPGGTGRTTCIFPEQCIHKGMNVAVEHDVYQGDDTQAWVQTSYSYGDPRFDAHGRGFEGFGAVDAYNASTYTETFTNYGSAFPFTSLPINTTQMTAMGPALLNPMGKPVLTRIKRTTMGYTAINSMQPGTSWAPGSTNTPVVVELSTVSTQEWEQNLTLNAAPGYAPHLYDATQPSGNVSAQNAVAGILYQHNGVMSYDCQLVTNTACYDNLIEAWASTTGGDSSDVKLAYLPANTTNWFVSEVGLRQEWKGPEATQAALHSAVTERDTGYTYDPTTGLLSTQTIEPNNVAPLQATMTYGRNANGLVTVMTASTPGQNEPNRVTKILYDPAEGMFPIMVTDPLGHETQQVTDPALGVPVAASDENGVLTTMTYDEFGRPLTITPTGAASTTMAYSHRLVNGNPNGTTVTVTSNDGSQASTQSDLRGRPVQSKHLEFDGTSWATTTQTYDGLGRLISWTPPGSATSGQKSYDTFGRVLQITTPTDVAGAGGGIVTQYAYAAGTAQSLTRTLVTEAKNTPADPANPTHIIDRDLEGRLVDTIEYDPATHAPITTRQQYGSFDELAITTDTNNNTIQTFYDAIGRPIASTDPDVGIAGVTYDGYGDVVTRIAGAAGYNPATGQLSGGVITTVYHDLLGRTTMTDTAATAIMPETVTSYYWDSAPNGIGKLFQSVSPDGVVYQPSYDTAGRTIQQSWAVDGTTYTFNRVYDAQGRVITLIYPQAPGSSQALYVYYGYTSSGFLQTVSGQYYSPCQGHCIYVPQPLYWTTNAMDPMDHITQGTYGNGIVSNRAYHANSGRVNYIDEAPAMNVSYVYDGEGMLQTKTDGIAFNSTESYTYDSLHRLESSTFASIASKGGPATTTTATYNYDVLGDLTTETAQLLNKTATQASYSYGQNGAGPHALTNVTSNLGTGMNYPAPVTGSLSYDVRGRVTSDPTRSATTWTEFDLPQTIVAKQGDISTTNTFEYDAQHTRVERATPTGKIITLGGLFEQRVSGTPNTGLQTTNVFYVPGPQGMVAQVTLANPSVNSTTTTEYLHTDVKGSTSAVSNAAKAVQSLYYKPFGQRANVSGQPITAIGGDVQLGFNDLRHDDDLGLIDQHGRVYDPILHHFMSPDPMTGLMSQHLHPYSYVGNNPINRIDPSGFCETPAGSDAPCSDSYNGDDNGPSDCTQTDTCTLGGNKVVNWGSLSPTAQRDLTGFALTPFLPGSWAIALAQDTSGPSTPTTKAPAFQAPKPTLTTITGTTQAQARTEPSAGPSLGCNPKWGECNPLTGMNRALLQEWETDPVNAVAVGIAMVLSDGMAAPPVGTAAGSGMRMGMSMEMTMDLKTVQAEPTLPPRLRTAQTDFYDTMNTEGLDFFAQEAARLTYRAKSGASAEAWALPDGRVYAQSDPHGELLFKDTQTWLDALGARTDRSGTPPIERVYRSPSGGSFNQGPFGLRSPPGSPPNDDYMGELGAWIRLTESGIGI